VFSVVERGLVTIDISQRTLTLRNMNLFGLRNTGDALDSVSLRGAGEVVRLRGATDRYGVGFTDPFLFENIVISFDAELRLFRFTELKETVVGFLGGVGWRSWNHIYSVVFLAELTHTLQKFPVNYAILPIYSQPGFGPAIGLEAKLDLNRLNMERAEYLGVHSGFRWLSSADILPGPAWSRWTTYLGFNLPMYGNRRGQHWVLHGTVYGNWVAGYGLGEHLYSGKESKLYAHRRLTPQIRGFSSQAIRERHTIDHDEVVDLGGLGAYTASLELRIPLPIFRNAIVPFLDGASVGARSHRPWENPFLSAGVAYRFSLFKHRFEGDVYIAVPFRDDVDTQVIGLGAGGTL